MTVSNVRLDIAINSGNAAMVDAPCQRLGQILRNLAQALENDGPNGPIHNRFALYDENGNAVGNWRIKIEVEK